MFAIIQSGGQQFKVQKGDQILVDKLNHEGKDTYTFDEVLMIDEKVGAPLIKGAKVTAKVIGDEKGDKITVFKMKPKKRYQKTYGHRSHYTKVEITDIKG